MLFPQFSISSLNFLPYLLLFLRVFDFSRHQVLQILSVTWIGGQWELLLLNFARECGLKVYFFLSLKVNALAPHPIELWQFVQKHVFVRVQPGNCRLELFPEFRLRFINLAITKVLGVWTSGHHPFLSLPIVDERKHVICLIICINYIPYNLLSSSKLNDLSPKRSPWMIIFP